MVATRRGKGTGEEAAEQVAASPAKAGRRGRSAVAAAENLQQQGALEPKLQGQEPTAGGEASAQQPGQQQEQAAEDADDAVLDAFRSQRGLVAALQSLLPQLDDPSALLQANAKLSRATRDAAKALYSYGVRALLTGVRPADKPQVLASLLGLPPPAARAGRPAPAAAASLPTLCVDTAFDPEQIWVQLEHAGHTALSRSRTLLAHAQSAQSADTPTNLTLIPPEREAVIDEIIAGLTDSETDNDTPDSDSQGTGSEGQGDDGEALNGFEFESDSQGEGDSAGASDRDGDDESDGGRRGAKRARGSGLADDPRNGRRGARGRDGVHDGMGFEDDGGDFDGRGYGGPRDRRNPVEDRFLAMKQMERFLLDAERQAAKAMYEEGSEGEDEDEDEDLHLMSDTDNEGDGASDEGPGFEDGGEDDDEERELRRALNKAAGSKGASRGGKDEKERESKAMYADFFGPLPRPEDYGSDEEDGPDDVELPYRTLANRTNGLTDDADMDQGDSEGDYGSDGEGQEDGLVGRGRVRAHDGRAGGVNGGLLDSEDGEGDGAKEQRPMSTHQKRLMRMQEQIRELEAAALGEKDWQLTGEVDAKRRPLNSALEIDMDFDTTVRPPPEPTEEAMQDIEEMIKRRIADHKFDDVVRIVPAPLETKRREFELQDTKAAKGLAEEYADDFTKAVGGPTEAQEEESKTHKEAKMLFQALIAKLDALSHFHFAPKPVVEDLTVRTDVAAVAMEEAAPVAVSAASMRLPGEVFKSDTKGAPIKAEAELTKEEKKQRRAKRKRADKAKRDEKEALVKARALAAGQAVPLPASGLPVAGRKSAALLGAGKKGQSKAGGDQGRGLNYGKSSAVFAKIQASEDAARAGGKKAKAPVSEARPALAGASLKL